MLAKRFRLNRCSLFPKTLDAGKKLCNTPYFLTLGLPRSYESGTPTRFGFIVSKKVHNRATRRNKVRRRLREIVRDVMLKQHPQKIRPYIAVVFIARKGILEASYHELQTALQKCMESR
jgi:ribonuclease P protein component